MLPIDNDTRETGAHAVRLVRAPCARVFLVQPAGDLQIGDVFTTVKMKGKFYTVRGLGGNERRVVVRVGGGRSFTFLRTTMVRVSGVSSEI